MTKRALLLLAVVLLAGCIHTPPVSTDPRFDPAFYRLFALQPTGYFHGQPANVQIVVAPVDDAGEAIPDDLLQRTVSALHASAPVWMGGTAQPRVSVGDVSTQPSIRVQWAHDANSIGACGQTDAVGGRLITLYYRQGGNCGCFGEGHTPITVIHELGHAMGYSHTGEPQDVMSGIGAFPQYGGCETPISAREQFHAQVAYQHGRA